MLQVKIINRINFPDIRLQEDLEDIAKNIIIPDMVRSIDDSKSITGGALPANEPSTIRRKGSSRPLINTGELRRSFFYKTSGKNKVIISIEGDRKEIGGHLQNEGVKAKGGVKFYRFFGISKYAYDTSMAYMSKKLKELTQGDKGGGRI